MNRESCQRYLEDPEANASHLAECAECRALADGLVEDGIPTLAGKAGRLSSTSLPLAPWEGAAHRSWPLVAAGALAVAVIAGLLFAATGASPLEIMRGKMPSGDLVASLLRLRFVQNAPVSWQVMIFAAFLIINAIFIMLLRRSPKGLDV